MHVRSGDRIARLLLFVLILSLPQPGDRLIARPMAALDGLGEICAVASGDNAAPAFPCAAHECCVWVCGQGCLVPTPAHLISLRLRVVALARFGANASFLSAFALKSAHRPRAPPRAFSRWTLA